MSKSKREKGKQRKKGKKSFDIPKRVVWEAYLRVKANQGAAGVDEQSMTEFEEDLEGNLYKLWNRMSSGSYMPAPVRVVEIPKQGGGLRKLGIPTIADRIAQTVVKDLLEPKVEEIFHEDSFGYRPGRSALDAVGICRERCWRTKWVIDLDIQKFFDTIDHDLLMRAVAHHTDLKWVLLYIARWLKAPLQLENGTLEERCAGTPQGAVISPLLANIFLHYAFDLWMQRNFPGIQFERYCDDIVIHCVSEKQAKYIKRMVTERLGCCKLVVHPQKTQIAFLKDSYRKGSYETERFDFLGYTFRPRLARSRAGKKFVGFLPAVSDLAAKQIRQQIRRWKIQLRTSMSLEEIAKEINVITQGWINYYGKYYPSQLINVLQSLNNYLYRWAKRKYKRLKGRTEKAVQFIAQIAKREPELFAHWKFGAKPHFAG